jgi:hypothetical protein
VVAWKKGDGVTSGEVTYVPYREDKLAQLILYIASRTVGDRSAGTTKLNKYLYFVDFAACGGSGAPSRPSTRSCGSDRRPVGWRRSEINFWATAMPAWLSVWMRSGTCTTS